MTSCLVVYLGGCRAHRSVSGGDGVKSTALVKHCTAQSWGGVYVGGQGHWPCQASGDAGAGLTGTAWSRCWGGICCVCSLLPAPPPAGRRWCHRWPPYPPPPAGVLPPHTLLPAPLTQPLHRPLGRMSCPGRHCITLSRLLLPRAGVTLTMKGLRFGFQGCCGVSVLGGMSQGCNGKVTIPPSIYKQHSILFFLLKHFLSSPLILPRCGLLFKERPSIHWSAALAVA